ncbi:MAG: hypothetical protein AAF211_08595, partial [Myxococcota bacterium]
MGLTMLLCGLLGLATAAPSRTPMATDLILPARKASTWSRARFTIGLVDLRYVGRMGEEAAVRRRLLGFARDRGLPVLGAEATGPDRSVEARFVLLGELRPVGSGSARMTWQLVDRRDGATTFEASTTVPLGEGRRPVVEGFDRLVRSPEFARALVLARRRVRTAQGPIQVRRCLTPGTHGRGKVGRGSASGAAVVISPDGFAWAAAHALPLPPKPIEIRTTTGTWAARWVAASAELDVALLALPTGADTPCAAIADHIPRAREPALAWHPRQGRVRTRILGFRLHERPGTIVVEQ